MRAQGIQSGYYIPNILLNKGNSESINIWEGVRDLNIKITDPKTDQRFNTN